MKMIGNKCFLDTSVIIHFFKDNIAVAEKLKSFSEIYVSSIVVGELYYGAYASANSLKHIKPLLTTDNHFKLLELELISL